MADNTKIEWTDATWNPVTGCSIVSPGCTNCYAMQLAGTRLAHHPSRAGLTVEAKAGRAPASGLPLNGGAKHVWTGQVRLNAQWLDQPLRWKKPRMIFVCAHGDLFHENVPDEWIDRVFAVMALAPQHIFQVLTKRSARMRAYLHDPITVRRIYELVCDMVVDGGLRVILIHPAVGAAQAPPGPRIYLDQWPLPNVWLGVSAEDQRRADERIPDLLATPAAIRWVSAEPLLGPLNLEPWLAWEDDELPNGETWGCPDCEDSFNGGDGCDCPNHRAVFHYKEGPVGDDGSPQWISETRATLDWVVGGGESGRAARPMHPAWVRSLRDQCAAAGTAFLFKQWGEFVSVSEVAGEGPHHHFADGATVRRVGKANAGRTLDGVLHDAFPEPRP
jgi:protein gp37